MKTNEPVVVEQVFNASLTEVWQAITQLEQMKQWFFDNIPSFDPVVGFQTKFTVKSGDRSFGHLWELMEVEPNKRIKYHWSYEEYDGTGWVTFELIERDEQTMLRVTNEGLETFPQDIPEFARESCQGGWEFFLQGNLKNYLDRTV